jgi:TolB-like protein
MKRCPECRRDYYDDSLLYCLDDGSALLEGPASVEEPSTAILHSTGPPTEAETRGQIHLTDDRRVSSSVSEGFVPRQPAFDKRLLAIPVAIAIIAGAFIASRYLVPASKQINSVAVLPFANESQNAESEYLSDGMTESLIGSLSQIPNLNVKARASVFRYKGKDVNPKQVGEELSVQAILNGRLLQRGNDLTLYVELIDTANENVLWKADYSRPMSNLVTLQSEIAKDVSNKLKSRLSGEDQKSCFSSLRMISREFCPTVILTRLTSLSSQACSLRSTRRWSADVKSRSMVPATT